MLSRRLPGPALAAFAALALGHGPEAQGSTIVVPNSLADVEGATSNTIPFDGSVVRYQQAYAASDLGPLSGKAITRIAWRLNAGSGAPGPISYANLRLTLSTGSALVDNLSPDLDLNLGTDARVVFDGPFTLPPLTTGSFPEPFDLVVEFSTPFAYQGGDLLVQIEKPASEVPSFYLDANSSTADSISRAFDNGAAFVDTGGLVTKFEAEAGAGSVEAMPDCGGNLATLTYVSGEPQLGKSVRLGMDAGQAQGVAAYLAFATSPAASWPPCGITLPGAGELLLAVPPKPALMVSSTATWSGARLDFAIPIPPDPLLVALKVYAQGIWVDVAGAAPSEPLRLTGGLAITIGN